MFDSAAYHRRIMVGGIFFLSLKERISSAGMGDVLMNRGWVLLHNPSHGVPFPTKKPERRFTKAQADYLYNYYIDRGETARANEIFKDM